MNGAVAAGHPLTAAAGARILAEGGNAADACVAAAFAAWVAESPLTGPGAGGFALVAAGGRPTRSPGRLLRLRARSRGNSRRWGRDGRDRHRVRRRRRPRRRSSGSAALRAPFPVRRAGLEAVHRAYGRLPWRELARARARACLGRSRAERAPQAHLHAILDLILRHTDEGRRLYSRPDGSRLSAGDVLRLPDLGETLEQVAAEGARVPVPRRARAQRSSRRYGRRAAP